MHKAILALLALVGWQGVSAGRHPVQQGPIAHPRFLQQANTTGLSTCDAQLMSYVTDPSRCKGSGDGTADLLRFLSRSYASCLENSTSSAPSKIVQVMAPASSVDYLAELILTTKQLPESIASKLLFFSTDVSHLTLEALLELATNVDTVSAGWFMSGWAHERMWLAQTVVQIDTVVSQAALEEMRTPPGAPRPPPALPSALAPPPANATSPSSSPPPQPPPPALMFNFGLGGLLGPDEDHEAELSPAGKHSHGIMDGIPEYFHNLATGGTDHMNFMPLDGSVNVLYYRRDILEAKGWKPPATWPELLTMARQLNGTDMNGDGQPDYGFCIEQDTECQYTTLVGSILAPMTQYLGSRQGALLDADTLAPLFNTTAFTETLQMMKQLAAVSPPFENTSFPDITNLAAALQVLLLNSNDQAVVVLGKDLLLSANTRDTHCFGYGTFNFQKGRCAFMVGSGQTWKVTQLTTNNETTLLNVLAGMQAPTDSPFLNRTVPAGNSTITGNATNIATNSTGAGTGNRTNTPPPEPWYAKGRMGFAPLPGSTRVLNRTTNTLIDCTADLCAFGLNNQPETVKAADGTEQYVNRAYYSPTCGYTGAASSAVGVPAQQSVGALWVAAGSAAVHNELALSARALPILPMRMEMLEASALPQYVSAGFNKDDTSAYLAAVTTTLAHQNNVPSPGIPGAHIIRKGMNAAAIDATAGGDVNAIASALQDTILTQVLFYSDPDGDGVPSPAWQLLQAQCFSALGAAPQDSQDYRNSLLNTYRFATGYYGWSKQQPPPPAPEGGGGIPTVSLVVPITCTVVVLALALLYELRKHIEHRKLFGKVVAPGPYKETTLLVTDIESSTTLWELLPPHVMDVTLHEHHACIRQLLLKHCGYESATEGDSFILAFNCPEDALLFAMECQVALLECAWPPELLECEQCAPYYVVQVETGSNKLVPLGLEGLDEDVLLAEKLGQDRPPSALMNAHEARMPYRLSNNGDQGNTIWEQDKQKGTGSGQEDEDKETKGAFTKLFNRFGRRPPALPAPAPSQLVLPPQLRPASGDGTDARASGGAPTGLVLGGGGGGVGDASGRLPVAVPQSSSANLLQGSNAPVSARLPAAAALAAGYGSEYTNSSMNPDSTLGKITLGQNTQLTQGGMSVASSPAGERTFLTEVQATWQPATASTPNAVLIFRGLRVRMGMTSGVGSDADVTYNKAAARAHYSGEIMVMAKAVSDAAAGGAVLLSETSYSLLPLESLWDKALVMHVGEYVLNDNLPQMDLYQVAGRRLLGRIAHLSVSRCKAVLSRGVLAAPLGNVTIVHAQAVGAMTLLSWNASAAEEALSIFKTEALNAMAKLNGGYVADLQPDQIIVVFPLAAEAILWGLNLHKAMLEANWPPELAEHVLCEELTVNGVVVFRGLRVKVGLDCGEVVGEVNALTGRCTYRGRPVTRSLRIMQMATSNQVLCTSTAWAAANTPSGTAVLQPHHVMAERLGPFKLKGLMEKADLLQCRFESKPLVNKRRASTLYFGPPGGPTDFPMDIASMEAVISPADAEIQIPTAPNATYPST